MGRKWIAVLLALTLILGLTACGNGRPEGVAEEDYVDLTAMSSTMVYAEVYRMMYEPEDFLGKTVKMRGMLTVYEGDDRDYFACIVADATACCAQGIEFVRAGDYSYPEDYPDPGSMVTVTGVFDLYTEGNATYCQLVDAVMR